MSVDHQSNHAVQSFLKDLQQKKRQKDKTKSLQHSDSSSTTKRRNKRVTETASKQGKSSKKIKIESVQQIATDGLSKRDHHQCDDAAAAAISTTIAAACVDSSSLRPQRLRRRHIPTLPPHRYIMAPMVGASELPFRLLCRKYGADLCYTPMMDATQFAGLDSSVTTTTDDDNNNDETHNSDAKEAVKAQDDDDAVAAAAAAVYRRQFHLEHAVHKADHPLVAHVSANTSTQLVHAAVTASRLRCDGLDLNLGCPQRTAFMGHFGSYLLDEPDAIADMVATAVTTVQTYHAKDPLTYPLIPISVKIRLLATVAQTIDFCIALCQAGVSLIAIHARYRASWERTSTGARDGPAMLDQVTAIQAAVCRIYPHVAIITNGNTITFDDVQGNLDQTNASGLMSAEGILDNPALFVERYGSRSERDKLITVWSLSSTQSSKNSTTKESNSSKKSSNEKMIAKLRRRLQDIEQLEKEVAENKETALNESEAKLLASKDRRERKLQTLLSSATHEDASATTRMKETKVTLGSLYDAADDKWKLAREYLDLATAFPVAIRTVVFHIRRMLKDMLVQYQLLDECLNCTSIEQVDKILCQIHQYRQNPASFVYDSVRAKEQDNALARKRLEEGKRKAYEARMMRKAKREGRTDLHHYLHQGAVLPTAEQMTLYRGLPRDQVLDLWKQNHSQHCLSFHLETNRCPRDRACAFLHVDLPAASGTVFRETDAIAG